MAGLAEKAAGLSLAGVLGGLYLVCALVAYALPEQVFGLGRVMFHGVQIEMRPIILANVLVGFVAWLAVGFAGGAVFARLYNRFSS